MKKDFIILGKNRTPFTLDDILKAKEMMEKQNIVPEGRYYTIPRDIIIKRLHHETRYSIEEVTAVFDEILLTDNPINAFLRTVAFLAYCTKIQVTPATYRTWIDKVNSQAPSEEHKIPIDYY